MVILGSISSVSGLELGFFEPTTTSSSAAAASRSSVTLAASRALSESPTSFSSNAFGSRMKRVRAVSKNLCDLAALQWKTPFLKRLSSLEVKKIELAIAQLSKSTVELVLKGQWEGLSREVISASIIKAHLAGDLDEMQAAHRLLFLRCVSMANDVQVHSLQTEDGRSLLGKAFPKWSAAALQKLQLKLQQEAPEESQFFTFYSEYTKQTEDMDPASYSIGGFIPFSFGYIRKEKKILNFILPPKLLQRLLEAEFGSQAVRVEPVLGYSPIEKFSDYQKRIVSIPFDLTRSEPDKIHEIFRTRNNCAIYQHDALYHCVVESANPHRAIWTEIALYLKEKDKKMGIYLLDRDLFEYVNGKNSLETFWKTLERNFAYHLRDYREDILAFIRAKSEEWRSRYGVDLFLGQQRSSSRRDPVATVSRSEDQTIQRSSENTASESHIAASQRQETEEGALIQGTTLPAVPGDNVAQRQAMAADNKADTEVETPSLAERIFLIALHNFSLG